MIAETCEFYMVWTKTGHVPRRVHGTRIEAETEAQRLAVKCPGRKFIVLQGVAKFHVPAEPVSAAEAA